MKASVTNNKQNVAEQDFTAQDHLFMSQAIELAKKGHFTTSPNPRVGCILVSYTDGIGKVIGEGYHQKAGQGHAEVNALAAANVNNAKLIEGATAYVTLEPCSHFGRTPPCAKALIDANVGHVIAAMVDPNPQVSGNGLSLLEKAGIKVQSGLLEQSAKQLNVGFIHKMINNLPYVRCKLAASLDGKTAMASGESQWITSSEARQDVQRLRAQSCAIITGADSVLFDNAKMTVRWSELGELKNTYPEEVLRQPLRVVIDSQNRLTPDLAIFEHESPILLINGIDNGKVKNKLESHLENLPKWPHFVEHVQLPLVKNSQGQLKINLKALLEYLATRGLNDILIESGAQLTGAFIEQDLVNELILYQAPKLMGGDGKNLVEMPGISKLNQAKAISISDIRMVGGDIRITSQFIPSK
ncbi:bifunctional diaminohydroxyphosphoribosylaminopyrimidine deaminase/5-amino-6-(5-phosphoribosylamino)uracil reductase RibD [Colwellia sp. 75C3]|uniref:bifunctional diaminohydroxyphosphoribosylaminopyrimidine deaminase/5-amino-6-(5-phosphoribosylamino)uracil reductase RibD n=1 Tax=Colwellia sp. 75C3 TaxID=888425 RepID=UPI000C320DFA|nr:bifunctional diaminohydroxyphosphoribosylaminopyrimidine deaminase/5-amino-6-(5-phosphoribosylamino)uracil reductase RibD [Colwellia sp. 75C3]PKG82426.1 bifunctional diaminohydroxyphosphoribosylaminopyrimidine deaminase/5-amino-6-(5-phosphoribosylamino)uracil reductase RibD [Colwellia sp. 75C3]